MTIIFSGPNETISVIVKCGNEDGGIKQDMAKHLHLFEKEAEMFSRTFPAIYQILGKRFKTKSKEFCIFKLWNIFFILGHYYTLSSKCLYTSVEPHYIIVLEDLTTLGFQMLPRHVGFDLEHCFRVVEKMAQLHAASVIMYEKVPYNNPWSNAITTRFNI